MPTVDLIASRLLFVTVVACVAEPFEARKDDESVTDVLPVANLELCSPFGDSDMEVFLNHDFDLLMCDSSRPVTHQEIEFSEARSNYRSQAARVRRVRDRSSASALARGLLA